MNMYFYQLVWFLRITLHTQRFKRPYCKRDAKIKVQSKMLPTQTAANRKETPTLAAAYGQLLLKGEATHALHSSHSLVMVIAYHMIKDERVCLDSNTH